jgi:hypothetical protein
MKQAKQTIAVILLCLAIACMGCNKYGSGCQGNQKMLTAGAGYTKFRK